MLWIKVAHNSNITPSTSTINTTSYSSHVTTNANCLIKSAGMVHLVLDMRYETGYKVQSGSAFAIIPEGFRPKVTRAYPARYQINNSEWGDYIVTINTNGQIVQNISNNFTACIMTVSYECA